MHRAADIKYDYTTQSHYPDTLSWHIILTQGQPVLVLSSWCFASSEETISTNFNAFGLAWPGPEPATSRLRGERSIHSATAAGIYVWIAANATNTILQRRIPILMTSHVVLKLAIMILRDFLVSLTAVYIGAYDKPF